MRLRERDKRPVTFKKRVTATEPDGTTYDTWGEDITVRGHVQPAGGRVMAEQYGERMGYMLRMLVEGAPEITESAGAWVNVSGDEPDYKVVAIYPWGFHTVLELEKIT